MKRKNAEISRLKNMIDKDRLSFSEEFFELVNADVNRVLREYFQIKATPNIVFEKRGEEIAVFISFSASGIKNFGIVPQKV